MVKIVEYVGRKAKPGRRKARKAGSSGTRRKRAPTRALTPYQQVLHDPCNGPLVSPYGGQVGNIARFDVDFTLNTTAGFTSGYLFWAPGALTVQQAGGATSNVTQTNTGINGPGSGFAPNFGQVRCVAACLTAIPSAASITNLTGDIGASVGSFNLTPGGAYSPDNLMQLTNSRGVLERRAVEVKWFPSSSDDAYNSPGALNGGNNYILFVYRGYPAGIAFNFRLTAVLEWLPSAGIGLPQASAPRLVAPSKHLVESAALHHVDNSWWNTIQTVSRPLLSGMMDSFRSFSVGAKQAQRRNPIAGRLNFMLENSGPIIEEVL